MTCCLIFGVNSYHLKRYKATHGYSHSCYFEKKLYFLLCCVPNSIVSPICLLEELHTVEDLLK